MIAMRSPRPACSPKLLKARIRMLIFDFMLASHSYMRSLQCFGSRQFGPTALFAAKSLRFYDL
jgi:hypothetical protein